MKYNIEKANINDLDEVFELQKNLEHLLISYDSLKEDLNSNNKVHFIAKTENNSVIGFIGISLLVDHVDIDYILVKEEYTRKHVASSILQHAIDYCKVKNISDIFLEVRASNKAAICLYEKFGFKNISTRKNYYPDNHEDALIYILKI